MSGPLLGSFARAGGGPAVIIARQFVESSAEILRLAKVAIDRGKAHVGDVVEFAQMLHDDLADRFRRNFALALALQLTNGLRDHLLDTLRLNRALAQRDLHRPHQLVAVERHAPAVALDHGQLAQLNPLESCETEIARQTDAAAADDR